MTILEDSDLASHASNTYSQSGEDGIIARIFDRIGTTNKFCFEVGAADGRWMSNTRRLIDEGWSAVLVECDWDKYQSLKKLASDKVKTVNTLITVSGPRSLDNVLDEYDCPQLPDLGIIDIDGDDYYVFNSLLKIKPRVVVVEFDPYARADFIPEIGSNNSAGYEAICISGKGRGYVPVIKTEFNVIFVRHEYADKFATNGKPKEIRLNLGGGNSELPGFINIDRKKGHEIYPIPASLEIKENSVDEIRASHVLEHLGHKDARAAIHDWARTLKPGGRFRIAVPDMVKICEGYLKGVKAPWAGYLFGGQTDADDFHRTCFDEEDLTACMESAGLTDIKHWTSEIADCAALPVSLNLEGIKGSPKPPEPPPIIPKTVSLMTLPRLAFTCNMYSSLEVAVARRLPFEKAEGVFWGQCMEGMFTEYVENSDVEWILTSDYDSVFGTEQFDALCRLMLAHPEADAIAPLQIRRDFDNPLVSLLDENGKPFPHGSTITTKHFEPDLVPAAWAHFGLTLIRTSAIRKMAHPWFAATPDKNGRWSDDKTDEDIYFWRKFVAAGNKVFVASHVPLIHAQLMYTIPDQDLKPRHIYPKDLDKKRLPSWVRR